MLIEIFLRCLSYPPLRWVRLVSRIRDSDDELASVGVRECDGDFLNFRSFDPTSLSVEEVPLLTSAEVISVFIVDGLDQHREIE
jgi:hypothetical protein